MNGDNHIVLPGLATQPADETEVKAELISVTYHNPENNYLVARVKIKSEPGYSSIIGCMPPPNPGELLILRGKWQDHARFGRQFHFTAFECRMPATLNGIRRYLGSGLIRGIGKAMADRLLEAFGKDVLNILDTEPERLLKIEGIKKKKLKGILESWEEQREIRDLMLFLQTHEIAPTFATRIFRLYGRRAELRIRENPYDLAYEIRGIGFRTADGMALKLGFPRDSRERLEAAVTYVLFNLSEKGHVFYPAAELLAKVGDMLEAVAPELLEGALSSLLEKKRIHVEDLPGQDIKRAVYLLHYYRWERETASRVRALAEHIAPVDSGKLKKILGDSEFESGIRLSEEQRQAVCEACGNKVYVITGGPGTGKTTIVKMIVRVLDKLGLKVKLAAPTGRAAKRLSEAADFPASTIHRLLGFDPAGGFVHNEEKKLKAGVLIVDEVSMLDAQLCVNLLRAIPLTCRLVLVGDVNQLPSVGPGNILGDILKSQTVPSIELKKIFRQAMESMIVVNAHRINEGKCPLPSSKEAPQADFFWVEQEDPEKVQKLILQAVCERIPMIYGFDPMREVQVLTPMHKGELGTLKLNALLQERLNPGGKELKRSSHSFRVGDRVLQTRNNYERDVFNGDLGWIREIDTDKSQLAVDFEGREILYDFTDADELQPAYAVSVHKSQGSEYPAIVMPILTQHFMLLQRNLIYTALTRARKLAVLIGSRKAMLIGLNNTQAEKRFTNLHFRLVEAFGEGEG